MSHRFPCHIAMLMLLLPVAGCKPTVEPSAETQQEVRPATLIATWDGHIPIYQEDYDSWLAWRGMDAQPQNFSDFATGWVLADLAREREQVGSKPGADEVVRQVRQHILGEALLAEVAKTASASIDDRAVEAELAKNSASYEQPRRYQLRIIFLKLPEDAEGQARVRTQIEALREQAINGADFAALASEHSQSQTRFREGRVGLVPLTRLPAPVAAAVAPLAAGQISPVIETGGGLSIYLCDRVVEARSLDEDTRRQHARSKLERTAATGARAALDQELLTELGLSSDSPGVARRLRELRAQRAIEAGLGDSVELAREIRWRTLQELARREMERRTEEMPGQIDQAALQDAFARTQSRGEGMVRFHVAGIAFGRATTERLHEAQTLLDRIKSGDIDFGDAARGHSLDGSAESGGDLGWFTVRTLAARDWMMMRSVRQIETGEMSGLIHSKDGLWIYRLLGRESGADVQFEDVRDELEARLKQSSSRGLQKQVRNEIERGLQLADTSAADGES